MVSQRVGATSSGMRVLVTGAKGRVGGCVAAGLVESGHSVRVHDVVDVPGDLTTPHPPRPTPPLTPSLCRQGTTMSTSATSPTTNPCSRRPRGWTPSSTWAATRAAVPLYTRKVSAPHTPCSSGGLD